MTTPEQDGIYSDRDGTVWVVQGGDLWCLGEGQEEQPPGRPEGYAPFTRLVPEQPTGDVLDTAIDRLERAHATIATVRKYCEAQTTPDGRYTMGLDPAEIIALLDGTPPEQVLADFEKAEVMQGQVWRPERDA